jgi:beta-lactamase family protein
VPRPLPEVRPRRTRPIRRALVVLWLGSLLVVLATATATPPPRPPAAPAPSPDRPTGRPDPAAPSPTAAIDGLVGASRGHVSIAALDLATGRSFAYGSGTPIHAASVVKLDVLETLLLQAQAAGRRLTPDVALSAEQMMENSDNDAATRLWGVVGGAEGIATANVRLGAHCTHLDDEHWGTSTTCAADQVALLRALVRPGPLGPAARSYAADLLTHVEDDQRWGVSAAADPGAATGLKNGWLPLDDDGGRWIVNSVGMTTVAREPVLLAVLTEHQPSEEAGIALVEALASPTARAVLTGGGPPAGP